jgi:hypothetical protein
MWKIYGPEFYEFLDSKQGFLTQEKSYSFPNVTDYHRREKMKLMLRMSTK